MKTLAKVCVALLFIGIVLGGIGFAVTGFDWDEFKSVAKIITDENFERQEKIYAPDAGITKIVLDARSDEIELVQSADDNIKIVFYASEDYKEFTYSDTDGVIRYTSKYLWMKMIFSFSTVLKEADKVYIAIPVSFDGDIQFETTNGKITATAKNTYNSLHLETTNGTITAKDFTVNKAFVLKTTNSPVFAENLTAKETLSIKTTNGKIDVKDCTVDKSFTAESTNGNISLTEVEIKGGTNAATTNNSVNIADCDLQDAEFNTTNSRIVVENSAAKSLALETSNASVEVNKIDCKDIDIKTTNNDIKVSLDGILSDWEIDAVTSNDEIEVNGQEYKNGVINGGAPNKLKVHTSNSDIEISIR
jgi:DUF4097 and DUF4098 domain-containing protein YvlB